MYEVRFHGRGGQGAVLASKILAKALADEGKYVKAIPSFAFERRGAPVAAYLRFDDALIRQNTNVYTPDCIICMDPSLHRSVNIFEDLKESGVWVQATRQSPEEIEIPEQVSRVGLCNAVSLALEIFGQAITNTIMLGAFARTTELVRLDSLCKGMKSVEFRDAALERNVIAVRQGYERTTVVDRS